MAKIERKTDGEGEYMNAIFEWFEKNFTAYQIVMLLLVGMGASLFYIGRVALDTASDTIAIKEDISGMRSEISDMKNGMSAMKLQSQYNHADTEYHKTADQIYALQDHIDNEIKNHTQPSDFERNRMRDLKVMNDDLNNDRNRLLNLGANR